MGNFDTIHKVVKFEKAVRGADSGPGSLLWYTLLDYVLYNAFCFFQISMMEKKLRCITSFKQLQKLKQKQLKFTAFLFKLCDPGCFGEMMMKKFFRGLREMIDHHKQYDELQVGTQAQE